MAMSTSKAIEVARRAHSREIRRRHTLRSFEHSLVRKAAVLVAAGTYGALKRNGIPDDVGGFPWKIAAWGGATLVEIFASGAVKAFAAGVSDATSAIYMDRSIVNKTLVSGAGGEF